MPQPYDPYYSEMQRNYFWLKVILVICFIIGWACITAIYGVDAEGATKVLQASGFKDIKITGYKWLNGTEDFYNTGFEATGPNGAKMSGNVSKGIFFKGSTVRFD